MERHRTRAIGDAVETVLRCDTESREAPLRSAEADDPSLRADGERFVVEESGAGGEATMGGPDATVWHQDGSDPAGAAVTAPLWEREGRVACPNCRSMIELTEADDGVAEVVCASCGSSVKIDAGPAPRWGAGRAGQAVGRFTLLERLGAGAFGAVYKALDPDLDRLVALKVLRAGQFATETDRGRFLREARNAARLRHPSVVAVHEVGEHEGSPFIVSDFIRGVTLADGLAAGRPPVREALSLAAEIADALQYAHEQGVVHRDVKPSNVMLDEQGHPHLMDFGLAKRDSGEVTMTVEGVVLGTPAYMSPEQARGEGHAVDPRGDVYSLGVVLYELLTGERPFRGNQRMLLHQVLNHEPPAPRGLNDRIPREAETVCLKAMAKEPARRYATAGELAEDLRRALRGEPVRARRTAPPERAWRWCRRNPRLAVAAASAGAGLLAAAVSLASYAALSLRVDDEHRQANSAIRDAATVMESRWDRSRFIPEQSPLARAEAITAAKNIRERLRGDHIGGGLRSETVRRVERVEQEVLRDERFSGMLEAFDRIRASQKETGVEGTAAGYAATALASGFDPLAPGAAGVLAAMLRDRPAVDRKALAGRLEAWAITEWGRTGTRDRWRRLIEQARAIDPDPGVEPVRDAWLAQDTAALNHLARVDESDRLAPSGLLMLVSWLTSARDRPRAVALLRRGVLRHPHDVWLNYYLGANLAELGPAGRAEAASYYRVARALRPGTGHELAHLLQATGHVEEAERIFRELTAIAPDNAQHLVCLGIELKRAGREREADALLARAVETAVGEAAKLPTDPGAQIVLGNALGQSGRVDEAIAHFRGALKLAPDLHNVHVNIADLLVRKKAYDAAVDEFRLALAASPGDTAIHAELGNALNGAGRTSEAVAQYQEALRLSPQMPRARLVLADLLRRSGRPDEAVAEYRKGLEDRPRDASSRFNLADLLARRGDIDEAVQEYRLALRDADSPDARFSLADLLRQDGRNAEAVEEYREALKIRPDVVPAILSLGLALRELGRYDESIVAYDRAVALSKNDREAASRIEQDGNWTRHLAALAGRLPDVLAEKAAPADASERALLARIALNQGNPAAAARLWDQAFADDPALASDPDAGYRADAIRAAALAATSRPTDATESSGACRWRARAAAWFRAELAACRERLKGTRPGDHLAVRTRLRTLRRTPDLASVRDESSPEGLSPAERSTWRRLWTELDHLLATMNPSPVPPAP